MKQIGFKNFRRFSNRHSIDFGNINLLVGGNNSGKSTVVKALLLITENLRLLMDNGSDFQIIRDEEGKQLPQEYHPEFNFAPNILHDALHIGTFERAINKDSDEDEIQLSVTYEDMFKVTLDIMKNESAELPTAPIRRILVEDLKNEFSINLKYSEQIVEFNFTKDFYEPDNLEMLFRHTSINMKDFRDLLSYPYSIEKINKIYDKLETLKELKKQEVNSSKGFSEEIQEDFDMIEKNILRIKDEFVLASNIDFSNGITIEEPFDKVKLPIPFLNGNLVRIGGFYRPYGFSEGDEQQNSLDNLHRYLYTKSFYFRRLGMILARCIQEPNTEYLYAHAVNQNTLYRINSQNDYMSNTIQEYFCSNIKKGDEEYKFIQKWMDAFNIASDFVITPIAGCEAYTVKIGEAKTKQNKWMNLAEKGMGSIQMMILLFKIATLIRKYRGTSHSRRTFMPIILIEEPEQNLHPSLQSKLADLFYEINRNYNIRFVVETHSEYLIRKAQVLVGKMECKTQEDIDEKNPFKVFYFPSQGVPYDMGMSTTGKFLNNFDEGFFDVAAKLNMEIIRRERNK
ncbi:MAG: AAA family ATPase [Bacteroidaceae bacterium]